MLENTSVLDIVAISVSAAALIMSIIQFVLNVERKRKIETIKAFDELERNEGIIFLFDIRLNEKTREIEENDIGLDVCQNNFEGWDKITLGLALLEHFAIGVLENIYDIEILNSMAGNKLLKVFATVYIIIEKKRTAQGFGESYTEIEKLCLKLYKMRIRKKQEVPDKFIEYLEKKKESERNREK